MNQTVLRSSKQARMQAGGVSRQTLYRWVKAGILPPPTKINGRSYWKADDLEALAAKGAPKGGDA